MSWLDWEHADDRVLRSSSPGLVAFRREHPVFRRRRFFEGEPHRGTAAVGLRRHRLVPARRARR